MPTLLLGLSIGVGVITKNAPIEGGVGWTQDGNSPYRL